MLFNKKPERFWNLIASLYAASPISDRSAYETKIRRIKTYLPAEGSLLDIGCGTGTQCGDLSESIKHITGIDISRKLLEIAEQRKTEKNLENIEFVRTTVFDGRFQQESFDVVTAFYVLHFIENIDAAFKQINELLKPEGLFIFETACLGEKSKSGGRVIRLAGDLGLLPKISFLTNSQLEQALEHNGFILLDKRIFSQSVGEYTYFARKA